MSKLERTGRFFDNLEQLGYDENRAFQLLSMIDNLETEITQLENQRNNLQRACNQEQQTLTQLQSDAGDARNDLARINVEISEAQTSKFTLSAEIKRDSDRIEFAEALCELFQEMPRISSELLELIWKLLWIYETGFKHVGFPIDYSEARETAIRLLEQAIGKGVVLREKFDKAVQQYDDLMLDKLGKMERERDKLVEMQAGVGQLMVENGVQVALSLESKGLIGKYKCSRCKVIIVHSIMSPRHQLKACPFCQANLLLSHIKDSLPKP